MDLESETATFAAHRVANIPQYAINPIAKQKKHWPKWLVACGTFRFKGLNLKVSALSAARPDLKVLGQDLHFPGGPVTKRPGKLHCKRTSKKISLGAGVLSPGD